MHRSVEQVTKEEIHKKFLQLLKLSNFSTTHGWLYYLEDKCSYCHAIYDFVIQCCLSIQWYMHVHIHDMTLFFVIQCCLLLQWYIDVYIHNMTLLFNAVDYFNYIYKLAHHLNILV